VGEVSTDAVPETAPTWAIRLEAKVDVALADHGGEIKALKEWKADAETRLRAQEARRFVAPLQLWTVTSGAAAVILAAAATLARFIHP
jgi:hypothetical protein